MDLYDKDTKEVRSKNSYNTFEKSVQVPKFKRLPYLRITFFVSLSHEIFPSIVPLIRSCISITYILC